MKKILLAMTFLSFSMLIKAQSISLGTGNEYCPNTEYEFTVTLPGPYHSISATQFLITLQPYAFTNGNTVFKFKGKFNDVNSKQVITVGYNSGNNTFAFEYKNVKSLFFANSISCVLIQPKFSSDNSPATSFNAPLCQAKSFSITFAKQKWHTQFEYPIYCFGTISDYEYLLPAGWKLGTNTSNGSAWIQGTNTVTITSDLSTGHNSAIYIRAKNTCGTNLANGQNPTQILINRSAANLTMSAFPGSISCGSTSPVTFTLNNTSSLSGITGYVWNLGSNNGWFFNGLPAPPTINTNSSTNSITLTPGCGVGLTVPSADITVSNSGNNCNINVTAATFAISAPALNILGNQALCSGTENYSLTGLPCNATNLWSVEPASGIVSLNPNTGPNTSLTRIADGNVTLTANVTACGSVYPVTLPIHVGPYSSSDFNLNVSGGSGSVSGYLPWCLNKSYGFSITSSTTGAVGSNYVWTIPQGFTQGYTSNYLCVVNSPSTPYPPTGTMNVSFTESCGTTINKSMFVAYSPSFCTTTNPCYIVGPNPATTYVNINVASSCIGSTYIKKVELVQVSTGLSVYYQDYSYGNVTSTTVYMYSYQTGTYILRVYDGSAWSSYTIMH